MASASASRTIEKERDGGQSFLFLNRIASSFYPFKIILTLEFSYIVFIRLRYGPSRPTFSRSSIMKAC